MVTALFLVRMGEDGLNGRHETDLNMRRNGADLLALVQRSIRRTESSLRGACADQDRYLFESVGLQATHQGSNTDRNQDPNTAQTMA